MDAYRTEEKTRNGENYRIEYRYDEDSGVPWENCEGHGEVSDWVNRDKRPGEFILAQDRQKRRFYDFAASVKIARRDGWNTAPYNWKTSGEQAHAAAMADFEYLRRWCADEWHYCGITVTALDDAGEPTEYSASIWGVEDDGAASNEYHDEIIQELIAEIECQLQAAQYPVATAGI